MTREEINEFNPVEPYCFETNDEERWYQIGCIDGLEAADEEPNTSVLWHDASEEPKRGSLILLIMPSGTAIVAKIIEPNHTFNHGERWAYISDLLPKGGDE